MIDPQTVLVAVACCVVIVAVWAWGLVREDAATARAHAAGIDLGRALERTATRNDPSQPAVGMGLDALRMPQDGPNAVQTAPCTREPQTGNLSEIPAWLRTPNDTERSA